MILKVFLLTGFTSLFVVCVFEGVICGHIDVPYWSKHLSGCVIDQRWTCSTVQCIYLIDCGTQSSNSTLHPLQTLSSPLQCTVLLQGWC